MDVIVRGYNYAFKELPDSRLHSYPLMSSPWQLLGIFVLYLYSIYFYLPSFMADRKPYNLKTTIRVYNVFQIVACSVIIYGLVTSGWTTHFTFGCQKIDPDDTMANRMAAYLWLTVILKLVDLIETVFFILRKKFNQVSVLHVYHHISTIILGWTTCLYYPGGMFSFPVILNCFVHILMYTYYLLASFGPEMQSKLQVVKPKLTTIQVIQLFMILLHSGQSLLPSCKTSSLIGLISVCDMSVLIYFFMNFYIKSYVKKKI